MTGEYARRGIGIKGPITGFVLLAIVVYATYWGWSAAFGDEPAAVPTLGCPTTVVPTGGATTGAGPSAPDQANPLVLLPSGMTVNVLNASERRGLAANTAAGLRDLGFNIGEVANSSQPIATSAEIRASAVDDPQVLLLQQYVPGATVVADGRPDASVDLVVGDKFTAVAAPANLTPVLLPSTPPC